MPLSILPFRSTLFSPSSSPPYEPETARGMHVRMHILIRNSASEDGLVQDGESALPFGLNA